MPGNTGKNIFRDKQTTKKVPLMLLDLKVLSERQQFHFWTLSTKKEETMYLSSLYKSKNKQ